MVELNRLGSLTQGPLVFGGAPGLFVLIPHCPPLPVLRHSCQVKTDVRIRRFFCQSGADGEKSRYLMLALLDARITWHPPARTKKSPDCTSLKFQSRPDVRTQQEHPLISNPMQISTSVGVVQFM